MATKKKSKKKWIAGSIKRKGALKKKAQDAGMTVSQFISKTLAAGSKASTLTKRQANEAKTLMKLSKKRKKKKASKKK